MADLKEFAEQLVNLTVKEVSQLATILKDEYGIEPAAAAAPARDSVHGAQGRVREGPERHPPSPHRLPGPTGAAPHRSYAQ